MNKLNKNLDRVKSELASYEAQMPGLVAEHEAATALVQTLNSTRFKEKEKENEEAASAVPTASVPPPANVNEAIGSIVSMVQASADKLKSAGAKRARPAVPMSDDQIATAKEAQATANATVERLMKEFTTAAQNVANLAATIQASLPVEEPSMEVDSAAMEDVAQPVPGAH